MLDLPTHSSLVQFTSSNSSPNNKRIKPSNVFPLRQSRSLLPEIPGVIFSILSMSGGMNVSSFVAMGGYDFPLEILKWNKESGSGRICTLGFGGGI